MSDKVEVRRTNKNIKTRVLWYATCNHCDKKCYRYNSVKVLTGANTRNSALICSKCSKKYHLKRKGDIAWLTL